jgi:hypothetical protein
VRPGVAFHLPVAHRALEGDDGAADILVIRRRQQRLRGLPRLADDSEKLEPGFDEALRLQSGFRGPLRYRLSARFETSPSKPSFSTARKSAAAPPSNASLNWIFRLLSTRRASRSRPRDQRLGPQVLPVEVEEIETTKQRRLGSDRIARPMALKSDAPSSSQTRPSVISGSVSDRALKVLQLF